MSYKRDPSDPDHSKNIEKAGEGFAWLRALREEKGNQLAHSLQTIYDKFPEHNVSGTVLLEKNPGQYLVKRYRSFFEAMESVFSQLDHKSLGRTYSLILQELTRYAAQGDRDYIPSSADTYIEVLTKWPREEQLKEFETAWKTKFPDISFAQSRSDCLADLKRIKTLKQSVGENKLK